MRPKLIAYNRLVVVTPKKGHLKLIVDNSQFFDFCESCNYEMHIDNLHWDADGRCILCEACLEESEAKRD